MMLFGGRMAADHRNGPISFTAALEMVATRLATDSRGLFGKIEIGLFSATLSIAARCALDPLLGDHLPFSMFIPAVLLSAIFGAAPAAALTLSMTTLAAWFLFLPERMSWSLSDATAVQILVFVVVGAMTAGFGLTLRGALIRLETHRSRHEVLVSELAERLTNDLLLVSKMASASLRATDKARGAHDALVDRLSIIADIRHDLSAVDWAPISVRRLAQRAIRHLPREDVDRIALEGPEVPIPASTAASLAVCIWELAQNARRHGALTSGQGEVRLTWRATSAGTELQWLEIGGPPPRSEHRGFGYEMLDGASGLGAGWKSQWLPGRVVWTLSLDRDGKAIDRDVDRHLGGSTMARPASVRFMIASATGR